MHAVFLSLALLAHPTVTDEAILGHGDPTPRFSHHYPAERVLSVPAGQTVTLPATFDYDVIEFAGTVRVSRDYDTTGKVLHLQPLPGGVFDAGTPEDPVLRQVRIVWANKPLATGTAADPGFDAHQIGNGLICFGDFLVHGKPLERTWTALTKEIPAGATEIELPWIPGGWEVGDELLIPDTRQPIYYAAIIGLPSEPIRMESPVTIAAINGTKITLSKPVDFAHLAARDPATGVIKFMPVVQNLTRNIVFESEDHAGTRGHAIFLEQALVDCHFASFLGMGRTLAQNLDSTSITGSAGDKIGLNPIARYAFHWHHVHGHARAGGFTGRLRGCVFDRGTDWNPFAFGKDKGPKWGVVQHGTHDLRIEDCIAIKFAGAGFVTEDGYEVRGQYRRNFAGYCLGNGTDGKFNLVAPNDIPGGEGAGFWFRGLHQDVQGCLSMCNAEGFAPFSRGQVEGRSVPSVPGGANDTPFVSRDAIPIAFADNAAVGNVRGFQTWNNPPFEFTRCTAVHNGTGFVAGNGEPGSVTLRDPLIVQVRGEAISTSAAYTGSMKITGGEIITPGTAIVEVRNGLELTNVTIQAGVGLNYHFFRPERTTLDGVLFKQYPGKPERHIVLGQGIEWKPGDAVSTYVPAWRPNDGKRFVLKNHNRTGQDYLLFEDAAERSKPAIPAIGYARAFSPESGLTNGQCWDRYGHGYYGGVFNAADVLSLPGLIYGKAKPGLDYPLGPPRAVMPQPNMLEAVPVGGATIRLFFYATGDSSLASDIVVVKVDDQPEVRIGPSPYFGPDVRFGDFAAMQAGTHTVRTWREKDGAKINPLTFNYFVGEPSTPPVEPEPDPDPPADPTVAELKARIEQLEREMLALLERIVDLENFRRDVKAAGE
jgi:hypothetical protein